MKSSFSLLGTIFRDNDQASCSLRNASLSMKRMMPQCNQDQRSYSIDRQFKPKSLAQLTQNNYLPLHRALHRLNIKIRKVKQHVFVRLINKPRISSIERTSRSNSQSSQKLYSNYKSILQKCESSNNHVSQFKISQNDPPKVYENSNFKNQKIQAGFQKLVQFCMVRQSKQDKKINIQIGFKSIKRIQNRNRFVKILDRVLRIRKKLHYDFFFMRFMKKVEQSLKLDFLIHSLSKVLLKNSFLLINQFKNCSLIYSNISQQAKQNETMKQKQLKKDILINQLCVNNKKSKVINNEVGESKVQSQESSAIKITNFDLGSQNWQQHSYRNGSGENYFQNQTPYKMESTFYNCTCQSFRINSQGRKAKSKSKITLHHKNFIQKCSIKVHPTLLQPQFASAIQKYFEKAIGFDEPLKPSILNSDQQGKTKLKNIQPENLVAPLTEINDSKFFIDQFNKKSNNQTVIRTLQEEQHHFQSLNNRTYQTPLQFRSCSGQQQRFNFRTQANDEGLCNLTTKFYSKEITLDKNQQWQQNMHCKSKNDYSFTQKMDALSVIKGDKQLKGSSSSKNMHKSFRQSLAPRSQSHFEQIDSMMKDLQKIKQKSNFNAQCRSTNESLALKDTSRQQQQLQNKYTVNLNVKKNKSNLKDIELSSTSKFDRIHHNSQNQSIFYSDKKSHKNSIAQKNEQESNIEAKLLALKKQKIQLSQNYAESAYITMNGSNGDKKKKSIVLRDQRKNSQSNKVLRDLNISKKNSANIQLTNSRHNASILKYALDRKVLY